MPSCAAFPNLTRDLLLALRNPFRKRGRLILSLVTLTFAGAVFMGIVNLQTSLNTALNEMFGFWRYDAWLIVDGYVPAERLVNEAKAVPGVREPKPGTLPSGVMSAPMTLKATTCT